MINLPSLEVTEDPSKKNAYIIYRYPLKDHNHIKQSKINSNNKINNKINIVQKKRRIKRITKKRHSYRKKHRNKSKKNKGSFFGMIL
jgi:hypothetical protein